MHFMILRLIFLSLYVLGVVRHTFSQEFEALESKTKSGCNFTKVPEIRTKHGIYRGKEVKFGENTWKLCSVVQYLGIPYAKPPVGERRWKKPVPLTLPRTVVRKSATSMKHICPQSLDGPFVNGLLSNWFDDAKSYMSKMSEENMSEDCLYLNIYVPMEFYANETSKPRYKTRLPVMVYFHGDSFMEGSGNFYDGSVLASYGKVIVVTFNYRLGVLGFLSTLNENGRGNYGLWDQLEALKWITENIRDFGGDSERITAFGSGAGAASINLLMLTVPADGKFHRVILQSGTALSSWAMVKRPVSSAKFLSMRSNISCGEDRDELTSCLRNKTWSDLVRAAGQAKEYKIFFGPVVDGVLLKDEPAELMKSGEFVTRPMIIGVTDGDGYGFIKRTLSNPAGTLSKKYMSSNFEKNDFKLAINEFVDKFYASITREKKELLRKIIEFMYTDWDKTPTQELWRRYLVDLYTDKQYLGPAVESAKYHDYFRHRVHSYIFSYRREGKQNNPPWVNAVHGDELPFVFGYPFIFQRDSLFPYNFTKKDKMVSAGVMTYWTNFAKMGDPMDGNDQINQFLTGYPNNFRKVRWTNYETSEGQSLKISAKPELFSHYRSGKLAFWNTLLPNLIKDDNCIFPCTGKQTANPVTAVKASPTTKEKTPQWSPRVTMSTAQNSGSSGGSRKSEGGMSLQLTITLSIGFVLVFVNIIAFSIVSYHKKKDNLKIQKLQDQLEEKKKLYNEQLRKYPLSSTDIPNGFGYGADESTASRVVEKTLDGASVPFTNSSSCFTSARSPLRCMSTTALPQLKPCIFRDDSMTSENTQSQMKRGGVSKIYSTYHSSGCGSPASMVADNSKEHLAHPNYMVKQHGVKREFATLGSGVSYNHSVIDPYVADHKYKTLNGKTTIPGASIANIPGIASNSAIKENSPWSVSSSAAAPSRMNLQNYGQNGGMPRQIDQNQAENQQFSRLPHAGYIHAIRSDFHGDDCEDTDASVTERNYLAGELASGSQAPLLDSPERKSHVRSDTPGSETDRTASSSRSDPVGSYCVTNNKINVVTKL